MFFIIRYSEYILHYPGCPDTRMKTFSILFVLLTPLIGLGQSELVPQKVTLKNGKSFTLTLPNDFEIVPAAEGLKRVRFFAKAPDGRIFVTDMYNLADNK